MSGRGEGAARPAVGGEWLGREGVLLREGVRVGVDQSEHPRSSLAKAHHVEHHHVPEELAHPAAGGAEGAAGVLAALAAGRVAAAEAESHPLGLRDQAG